MISLKLIPLEERIVLDSAALVAALHINQAAEHIIYVNQNAPGAIHDGTSWAHAFTNLQQALNAASPSGADQIWVAKGTYTPGPARTDTFNIPDQTSIYGGFIGTEKNINQRNSAKNVTILSGDIGTLNVLTDNTYTIVTVGSFGPSTVTLDGFTVTGAYNDSASGGSGAGGGLLEFNGSTLTLSDMKFTNDFATTFGGGVYATGNAALTISNSQFTGDSTSADLNVNVGRGGGVRAEFTTNVIVTGTDFNGNTALTGAGIYSFGNTNSLIQYSTFENNFAANNSALRTNSNINDSITHNIVDHNKGMAVIAGSGTNVTISYNTITNNEVSPNGTGGALQTQLCENVVVSDNLISNNTNNGIDNFLGHAGYLSFEDVNVTVSRNVFSHNVITDPGPLHVTLGGGMGIIGYTTALVTSNSFIDNQSEIGGGFLSIQNVGITNSTLTLTNNLFKGNIAGSYGGAMSLGMTSPAFFDSSVTDNTGPLMGDPNVLVSGNIFMNNKAGISGGAIASAQEGNLNITKNLFNFNSAANGGAINDVSSTTLSITSNAFTGNSATSDGNSIWLDGLESTVNGQIGALAIIDELKKDNAHLVADDIFI